MVSPLHYVLFTLGSIFLHIAVLN